MLVCVNMMLLSVRMINMIVIDSWDAVYDTFCRELGCCWYRDTTRVGLLLTWFMQSWDAVDLIIQMMLLFEMRNENEIRLD